MITKLKLGPVVKFILRWIIRRYVVDFNWKFKVIEIMGILMEEFAKMFHEDALPTLKDELVKCINDTEINKK